MFLFLAAAGNIAFDIVLGEEVVGVEKGAEWEGDIKIGCGPVVLGFNHPPCGPGN